MDLTKHADQIPTPPELTIGKYRHYKGKIYQVLGIATHTETLEFYVMYEALYDKPGSKYWVRPYDMFIETVEVNGKVIPRFEKIDD